MLDAKQVSILVYTLGRMGASFGSSNSDGGGRSKVNKGGTVSISYLPRPVQRGLLLGLANTLGEFRSSTNSYLIGSSSSIGSNGSDDSHPMTSQGLSNTLHGLVKLGLRWRDIPVLFQEEKDDSIVGATGGNTSNSDISDVSDIYDINSGSLPTGKLVQARILVGVEFLAPCAAPTELSSLCSSLALLKVRTLYVLRDVVA